MLLPTSYIKSFCEIKGSDSKLKYTGFICDITDYIIKIDNLAFFDKCMSTDIIFTILNQTRGLQVYKAELIDADEKTITIGHFSIITANDRRMAFRAIVNLPALVVLDDDVKKGYDALIMDMSIKGLSLWLYHDLKINDTISVKFPLGDDSSRIIKSRCNVVRPIGSNSYNMKKYGCDFVPMSSDDAVAVQAYMNQQRTIFMRQQMI